MRGNDYAHDDESKDREPPQRRIDRRSALKRIGMAGAIGLGLGVGTGLTAAQSGDEHVIVISDPDGGDLNDYNLVVSGEVERLDDPQGDDVSADGTEASGTVAGGQDGYRYTGEIVSFTYEPEVDVTIDGSAVDPDSLGSSAQDGDGDEGETPRTIVISDPDGSDTNDYAFTVSDDIRRLDDPRGDDVSADGTEASGTVAGGQDGYRITGSVTSFDYEGDIDVTIDGESTDPDSLGDSSSDDSGGGSSGGSTGESEIRLNATGDSFDYEFTVSGDLRAGEFANSGDDVAGDTATGGAGGSGKDNFYYTGEITSFDLDGPAVVEIDGDEVDPDSLGDSSGDGDDSDTENEIRLNAVGGSFDYEFSVSGSLRGGAFVNSGDEIDGSTAIGQAGGSGTDNYFFTGEITDWSLDGPAEVFIDGEQVDEDDPTGGSSGSGSDNGPAQALFIFDDGNDTALLNAKPILDEFGWNATTAIITGRVKDSTGSSYLTFNQIERLDDAGWEIASHTVSHDKLTELSETEWKRELRRSKRDLEEWGYGANCIVYPKGGGNEEIAEYADRFYEIGFGGGGLEPPNFQSQLRIGRYKSHEPGEVFDAIEREAPVGGTVPIMCHNIVEGDPIGNETTVDEFREICEAVDDAGMDVLTASEYEETL